MNRKRFQGKVVIVTGAGSGIGAETTLHFAREGAKLSLVGRRVEKLEETRAKCQAEGTAESDICLIPADVTNEEKIKEIVDKTTEKFGAIDVLVNNAGRTIVGNIEKCSSADLDDMYTTNVKSVYMLSKACLPHLERTKGNIVNVSSIAGTNPLPYCITYSMAKAMVDQFTQCLALDVAAKGVRVNAVNPGAIVTEIFTHPGSFVDDPKDLPDLFARMAAAHPMQRVGQVDEVANAITWLASDEASFTSGALIPIDGARFCTTHVPAPAKK